MASGEQGLLGTLGSVLRAPVPPERRGRLTLGWWILLLFAVQIVTGTLLSFYYEASPDMAAESVRYIMRDVGFGWLMRGLHVWSSHGMIALGLIQMLRVLFAGSYRGAGAASWYIGIALFFLVGLFAFTGGLLPWDDAAHGAAVRSLAVIEAVPGVGPWFATVLRGGEQVASSTLSRFYSAHVLLLPWIMFFLVLINLWFLSRRRSSEGGRP